MPPEESHYTASAAAAVRRIGDVTVEINNDSTNVTNYSPASLVNAINPGHVCGRFVSSVPRHSGHRRYRNRTVWFGGGVDTYRLLGAHCQSSLYSTL